MIDDMNTHPDDDTLFDLADGSLDAARADAVGAHVAHCSACAAFVDAAATGEEALRASRATMPEAAARSMQARLAGEWRSRVAAIAAEEAALDAGQPTVDPRIVTSPSAPPQPRPDAAARWSKRLVPILAFTVLATLAGTSVLLEEPPRGGTPSAVEPGAATDGAAAPGAGAPSQDAREQATPAAPAATDAREQAAIEGGATASGSAAPTAPAPEFPVPSDGVGLAPPTCVAGTEERLPVLPGGRLATQVVEGPLGLLVVCG